MKVLLKGCKRKKRQKRKPKRRKKKVINDKFFNTSRLFLFLLLLKGRCQINHISIGPLQRINSNFLKSIPCCFHMGITCTVNFGVCYFYNNTTIPKKKQCNKSRWWKSHEPYKKCGCKTLFQSIYVLGHPDKTLELVFDILY